MSELEAEFAIFDRPSALTVGADFMPMIQIDERHRSLVVAALHSHADHLETELPHRIAFAEEDGSTAVRSVRERTLREKAEAMDLARDLECR